jgi:hypothetical protein
MIIDGAAGGETKDIMTSLFLSEAVDMDNTLLSSVDRQTLANNISGQQLIKLEK